MILKQRKEFQGILIYTVYGKVKNILFKNVFTDTFDESAFLQLLLDPNMDKNIKKFRPACANLFK